MRHLKLHFSRVLLMTGVRFESLESHRQVLWATCSHGVWVSEWFDGWLVVINDINNVFSWSGVLRYCSVAT